jgi:hypothetical protein
LVSTSTKGWQASEKVMVPGIETDKRKVIRHLLARPNSKSVALDTENNLFYLALKAVPSLVCLR